MANISESQLQARRFLVFIVLLCATCGSLLISLAASAQETRVVVNANTAGTYSPTPELPKTTIRGRVLYEDTGRPVRRAGITLMSFKGERDIRAGLTDSNGVFEVKNVPEGRYYANINAPGVLSPFAYSDFTRRSPFEASGEVIADINERFEEIVVGSGGGTIEILVRAKRGAAISGRVYYADGDPAIGVRVEVLRKRDEQFVSTIPNMGELFPMILGLGFGGTDDRGVYRVSGLPPGEYVVRVTEPALHKADYEARGDVAFSSSVMGVASLYSTYYPDARNAKQASVVKLEAGQETSEINIAIPDRGSFDVSGRVIAGNTEQPVSGAKISILRDDDTVSVTDRMLEENGEVGNVQTNENGEWSYKNLPSGTYKVRVKPPYTYDDAEYGMDGKPKPKGTPKPKLSMTEKEIVISNENISGFVIEMPAGAILSGKVLVEGNKSLPNYVSISLRNIKTKENFTESLPGFTTTISPGEQKSVQLFSSNFKIDSLTAGKYEINAFPSSDDEDDKKQTPAYYVKSIRRGEKDLAVGSFEISESENFGDVQIVLAADGGILKGKVRQSGNQPAVNRELVLVSTDENKALSNNYCYGAQTDAAGEFELRAAPGEYFVIFLTNADFRRDFRDLEKEKAWIREKTRGAEKVMIKAGETNSVNLTAF